jgi:hypothetical protein
MKIKHGMYGTRLYKIWDGMIQRCTNSNRHEYTYYKGRGISVCDEWLKFIPFMEWAMANGYSDDLTIDRVDNDGNYEPGNCKWVNRHHQVANSRKRPGSCQYRGVSFRKDTKKWTAYIKVKPTLIRLGCFSTAELAAKARDNYIIENKLFEYKLNF